MSTEESKIERFVLDPTISGYREIQDKGVARELLNKDTLSGLFFLYKIGYCEDYDKLMKLATIKGDEDKIRQFIGKVKGWKCTFGLACNNREVLMYESIGRILEKKAIEYSVYGLMIAKRWDLAEKMLSKVEDLDIRVTRSEYFVFRSGDRKEIKKRYGSLLNDVTIEALYGAARSNDVDLFEKVLAKLETKGTDIDWERLMLELAKGSDVCLLEDYQDYVTPSVANKIAVHSAKKGNDDMLDFAFERGANDLFAIAKMAYKTGRTDILRDLINKGVKVEDLTTVETKYKDMKNLLTE